MNHFLSSLPIVALLSYVVAAGHCHNTSGFLDILSFSMLPLMYLDAVTVFLHFLFENFHFVSLLIY